MPRDSKVDFCLYRLNWVDDEDVLPLFRAARRPRTDLEAELESGVFEEAASFKHDSESAWGKTKYKWALRTFQSFPHAGLNHGMASFVLARAELERYGPVITDKSIESGYSSTSPPAPDLIRVVVLFHRHIAAIQYNSSIMRADAWRQQLHQILAHAARVRDLAQVPRFEPIAPREELMDIFASFEVLKRLRVKLYLANPDLTEYTKQLHDRLVNSRIQTYTQDMKNAEGLNKDAGGIPRATVEMAQAGYKEGEVYLAGEREGVHREVRTGQEAARVGASIEVLDAFDDSSEATGPERTRILRELATQLETAVDEIQRQDDDQ